MLDVSSGRIIIFCPRTPSGPPWPIERDAWHYDTELFGPTAYSRAKWGCAREILSRQETKHGNTGQGPWLVGEKYSYADISFVIWQQIYATLMGEASGYNVDEYPRVKAWMDRMTGRPKVAAALQAVFTGLAAQAQAQAQMKEAQKQ